MSCHGVMASRGLRTVRFGAWEGGVALPGLAGGGLNGYPRLTERF